MDALFTQAVCVMSLFLNLLIVLNCILIVNIFLNKKIYIYNIYRVTKITLKSIRDIFRDY